MTAVNHRRERPAPLKTHTTRRITADFRGLSITAGRTRRLTVAHITPPEPGDGGEAAPVTINNGPEPAPAHTLPAYSRTKTGGEFQPARRVTYGAVPPRPAVHGFIFTVPANSSFRDCELGYKDRIGMA